MPKSKKILDWWFDPDSKPRWFDSTPEFDQACRDCADGLLEPAASGELDDWARTPREALALIILLDQIPRNIYRGSPKAFATDEKARVITRKALESGFDEGLSEDEKTFLYMPLEHSEVLDDQNRSVALFEALGDAMKLDYAIRHQVIVERFGRFPHRNKILGRKSTQEELDFLKEPNSSF